MFNDSSTVLQNELAPGESLLWSGQPRQGVFLRPSDALLIPFSLLWGGFAVFWEASVIATGAPFFFKLWGIPFVLVGLYITVGRFFFEARQRADTHYGVTTERILIVTRWPSTGVKSLPLRTLSEMSLDQQAAGTGTITFGPSNPFPAWGGSGSWPGSRSAPSFERIAEARAVYEIIRSAQKP